MKRIVALLAVGSVLLLVAGATPAAGDPAPRFVAVDVRVDAGDAPLAAYQVEVSYDAATTKILSLEGGATEAFREAPSYDRRGFTAGRIVVAAFAATDDGAPRGETRVARLHLRVAGEAPAPAVTLMTAARPGGEKIAARATLVTAAAEDEGR